jgi:hypothetical protein
MQRDLSLVGGFVGGDRDGTLHGKNDELVALPTLDFPAWLQTDYL